jgi:alpha-L-rhamnosidase
MFQTLALTCEYLPNPLGLDVPQPRLFWRIESDRRGARQTAYQVRAAATKNDLDSSNNLLWDSGKVLSAQTTYVPYGGPALQARQRVWWQVRAWDESDTPSPFSAPAWWEMGLLDRQDLTAQWIGGDLVGGPQTGVPSPYLRRAFTLDQPVMSARLYVTALGLYEVLINGQPVSEDVLRPGYTDYRQRIPYQTYDVSALLQPGDNVIGAVLGDGWYCGHIAEEGRQRYGDRPRLLAQLEISLADGRRQVVISDEAWQMTTGPLLEADLLMGESVDARLELDGWALPGYAAAGWRPVTLFDDPGVTLTGLRMPPVRRVQEIAPVKPPTAFHIQWNKIHWVYDLGQNMVGWVRLAVRGQRGATVGLRFAEMLNPDGTLYTENLRLARATDYFTLRGEGTEVFEPRFTFHGFRYVEISYPEGSLEIEGVTGVVLHTDLTSTGSFECSDPLITQLQHNIQWGQKGNFLEIPTDCPQRSERLGWTGDAQVFVRTAAFNMNVAPFFTKWLQDLADAQTMAGNFPPFAPATDPSATDGGPAWSDAGMICPWTIYQCFADQRLLEQHYASLCRFIEFLSAHSPNLIRAYPDGDLWGGYGDWLSINAETPKDLIGTAYYVRSVDLMRQIAAVLGKADDAARFADLADRIRQAFRQRFVTSGGLIAGQTQTAYVLALHFDLLPPDQRAGAVRELVRDIERRGMHLSTGFVGTPHLLPVLSAAGQLDTAYALLRQTSWPSWLYPVTQGATTIWERWDGWTEDKGFQTPSMNSFNHYAYGAVGAWMYAVIGGIDLDQPGYKHILLHPRPGGGITWARAALDTLHGTIRSEWQQEDRRFEWRISVPPNTTATAIFPAGEDAPIFENDQPLDQVAGVTQVQRAGGTVRCMLAAGDYHFVIRDA